MQFIPFSWRKKLKNKLIKSNHEFKGKEYLIRSGQTIEERFIGNAYIFHYNEIEQLLKPELPKYAPQEITRPYYQEAANYDDITKMQYIDLNLWLKGDILRKADHISMANSLEVRVPFLDKEVWQIASKLPVNFRVNKKETKSIFRKVATNSLPKSNSERKKLGFPVPLNQWFKEKEYYQMLSIAFASNTAQTFFNTKYLNKLLDDHYQNVHNNARKLWTIYIFIIWYQQNFN